MIHYPRIILASQSPRRKSILEWAGVEFEMLTRHTDEHYPPDLPITDVPEWIAFQKAFAVKKHLTQWQEGRSEESTHLPIVAADTIVVLDGEIIGKPESRQDAIASLQKLSGKEHAVITGVVILTTGSAVHFSETTHVQFYPLSPEEIEYYVDKYEPYDKAGAYAIQEWIGVVGIKSISGDFYNVMGLPISKLLRKLSVL
jgi:septum formation protein